MQEGRLDPATLKVGDEVGYWNGGRYATNHKMLISKVERITPSGMIVIKGKTLYKGKYGGWFWRGENSYVTLHTPEHARTIIAEQEEAERIDRNRYKIRQHIDSLEWRKIPIDQLKRIAEVLGVEWEEQ